MSFRESLLKLIDTFVLTTDDDGTAWDVYVAGQAMGVPA